MKRSIKITILSAVALVVIGLVLAAAAFAAGFTGSEQYEAFSESFPDNIKEIRTDITAGRVHFYRTDEDQITILYYDNENHYFNIEEQDQRLTISRRSLPWYQDAGNWFHFGGPEYDVEVGIPSGFQGSLILENHSGSTRIQDIQCLELKIKSSSGSIHLDNVESKRNLEIEASSGRIELTDIRSQNSIDISNTSGGLEMDNVDCGGDLSISGRSGSQKLSQIHAQGGIVVTASSGGINGDNIVSQNDFSVSLASGGIHLSNIKADSIQANSSSGSIRITKMDAQSIGIQATSGSVYCSVIDAIDQYTVFSETTSGSNHLASGAYGGNKVLDVRSTSGSINFTFEDIMN